MASADEILLITVRMDMLKAECQGSRGVHRTLSVSACANSVCVCVRVSLCVYKCTEV